MRRARTMVRDWVRWMAVLGGGLAAGLCVGFLHLKVQQANLEPTLLLKFVLLLLLCLGVALPALAAGEPMAQSPPTGLTKSQCHPLLAMAALGSVLAAPVRAQS